MSPSRIVLEFALFLTAAVPTLAIAQDAAVGAQLFRQRCGACHATNVGQNRVGPHLVGIVGRAAATVDGARYSQAMRDAKITWDASQLEAFIANPRAKVPGTTMAISVPNVADRANIVAYLQGLASGN